MRKVSVLLTVAIITIISIQGLAVTQDKLVSFVETKNGEFYGSFRVEAGNSQFLRVSLQDWDIKTDGTQSLTEERPNSLNSLIQGVYTTKKEIKNPDRKTLKGARKRELPFRLNISTPKTIIVKGKLAKKLKDKFLWGGLKLIYASENREGGVTVEKGVLHKLYYEPDVKPKMPRIRMKREGKKLEITIKNKSQIRIFAPQKKAFFRIIEGKKGTTKDIPAQETFLVLPGKKLKVEFELKPLINKLENKADTYNLIFAIPYKDKFSGAQLKVNY